MWVLVSVLELLMLMLMRQLELDAGGFLCTGKTHWGHCRAIGTQHTRPYMSQPYYVSAIAQGPGYEVLDTDDHAHPSVQLKVVIVGDSGCGKTSLFSSYIRGSFPLAYEPTIFENHRTFVRQVQSQEVLSADLWDTAGQEEYERLRRLSYQDADVVIVAYSVDAPESLPNIHEVWAPEVMTYAPRASIILVGLKDDMAHAISPAHACQVAESIGAVAHLACSSIRMYNVNELFNCVFNTAYNKAKMKKHHNSLRNSANANSSSSGARNNTSSGSNTDSSSPPSSRSKRNSFAPKKLKKSSKCTIL